MNWWRRGFAALRFFKAERPVQRPGSRGGRYWITPKGDVRYGEQPAHEPATEKPAVTVDPESQVARALARGVYTVRVLETKPSYYWKDEKPDYKIALDAVTPPGWVTGPTRPYPFDRPERIRRYDPALAAPVVDSDPAITGIIRLRPDTGLLDGMQNVPAQDGVLWRGMSAEEYAHIQHTGVVQSLGEYNFVEQQQGLTYYSTDPTQAESYAHEFAPWQWAATPTRPAYIIGVRDPGNAVPVAGTAPNERGIPTPVPVSDIVAVYEGVPYSTESGTGELTPSRVIAEEAYQTKNVGGPRTSVAWRPIKMATESSVIASAAFKGWFADSKVVDDAGKPLVVYHGTKQDVREFDRRKAGASDPGLLGPAFYFTPSGEQASSFATSGHYGKGDAPNVMPVYVSLQHPAVIVDGKLPDGRRLTEVHPQGITRESGQAVQEDLRFAGYDGAIFKTETGEVMQVVAFVPTQIKSAIGNVGTFDPGSKNITKGRLLFFRTRVQLGLFDKPVEKPGSRGGMGYYDRWGKWQYGEKPTEFQAAHPTAKKEKKKRAAPGAQNTRLEGEPDLASYDWLLVNISGGKDSQAALDETVRVADAQGVPRSRIVAVHEVMTEVDHPGANELSARQAAHYGVRFELAERTLGSLLEHAEEKGKFPGMGNTQWCTSDHKRAQADKLITQLCDEVRTKEKRAPRVLNIMGLRGEEHENRANQPYYAKLKRFIENSKKDVDQWLPIQRWSEADVWARIKASGVESSPTYAWADRFSCPFCIYGKREEHVEAARHYPELAEKYARVEEKTGHTLVAGRTMREVIAEAEKRGMVKARPLLFLRARRKADASQLALFGGAVQHPGSRGGHGYYDSTGEWHYGDRPEPHVPAAPEPPPTPAAPARPIETPAFKNWFGDWEHDPAHASKVVDAAGEPEEQFEAKGHPNHQPLVMYHGSQAQFREFDPTHIGKWNLYGPGFYFTNEKSVVEGTFDETPEHLYFDTEAEAEAAPNRVHFVWQHPEGNFEGAGKWVAVVKHRKLVVPGYQHKGDIKLDQEEREKIVAGLRAALAKRGPGYLSQSELGNAEQTLTNFAKPEAERRAELEGAGRRAGYPIPPPMSLGDLHGMVGGQPYNLPVYDIAERQGVNLSGKIYACYLNIRDPVDMEAVASPEFVDRLWNVVKVDPTTGDPVRGDSPFVVATTLRKDDLKIADPFFPRGDADPPAPTVQETLQLLSKHVHRRVYSADAMVKQGGEYETMDNGSHQTVDPIDVQDWPALLKAAGYDGITHTGGLRTGRDKHRVYIAFAPTQIKAVENEGTFDPGARDIFKARRAAVASGQLPLLFGSPTKKKKPVQHPGSRGGKGYFDSSGEWIYGDRPEPEPPKPLVIAKPAAKPKPVELTYEDYLDQTGALWKTLQAHEPHEQAWKDASRALDALEEKYPLYSEQKDAAGTDWKQPEATPAPKEVLTSPAFKSWFGDWQHDPAHASKVVKKSDGTPAENYDYRPVLAFHGTRAGGFRSFDPTKGTTDSIFGKGMYFTEDKGIAQEYTTKDASEDVTELASVATGFRATPDGPPLTHIPRALVEDFLARVKAGDMMLGQHKVVEGYKDYPNPNYDYHLAVALTQAMEPQGANVEKFLAIWWSDMGKVATPSGSYRRDSKYAMPGGLVRLAKVLKLTPVVAPPEVFEVYLNVRKPFDMDEPITDEEMADYWRFSDEQRDVQKQKQAAGEPHLSVSDHRWEVDDLMPRETAAALFGEVELGEDKYKYPKIPERPTRADLLKTKAALRPEMRTIGYDPAKGGRYTLDEPVPVHGIFRLSPVDVLTKGDFHYMMTDGHHWLAERDHFTAWLQARGYDGMAHTGGFNIGTHNHRVWIVYKAEQVKAAKNEGTFDPTNPDMFKGGTMRLLFTRGVDPARLGRVCVPAGTMKASPLMFLRHSRDGFAKAQQLGLFDKPAKPVEKPGSRGGHGYYDDKGEWQYGDRPAHKPTPTPKKPEPEKPPVREQHEEPKKGFSLTPEQGSLATNPEAGAPDPEVQSYYSTLPKSAKPVYDVTQGVEGWEVLESEYMRALVESNQKRLYKKGRYQQAKEITDPDSPFGREAQVAIRKLYGKAVRKAISNGKPVPLEVVNQHKWPEFRKAIGARERYQKGWHTSFANKSIAVTEDLVISHGVKVKRQDGLALTNDQRRHLAGAIDELSAAMDMGNLADVWRQMDVTVAHTNGKMPFLKKAGGLFVPSERTISVGIAGIAATAHELLGHALDAMSGIKMGYSGREETREGRFNSVNYISSVDRHGESDNARLIRDATRHMNNERMVRDIMKANKDSVSPTERAKYKAVKVGLGHYWRRPFEVWARLCEQYVATVRDERRRAEASRPEAGIGAEHPVAAEMIRGQKQDAANAQSWYEAAPGWWTREDFAALRPLVESELKRRITIIRTGKDPKAAGIAQQDFARKPGTVWVRRVAR